MRGALHTVCLAAIFLSLTLNVGAQCNTGYTFTASPAPSGGQYQQGQAVTFCYTVTDWTIVNVNWFQGMVPSFGAGWDISTLVPGPPPATCGPSLGTWDWFAICDGTATTAIGPVGPGFFFDLDNDGVPGNNFGDMCEGPVNWQFCFTITVAGGACVEGANLGVTVNTYGDSETGSWSTAACQNDPLQTMPSTLHCCSADAGSNGVVAACSTGAAINLATLLGGTPDPGGTWTAPGGAAIGAVINPATAASGNYTYTVNQVAPVCSSSAIVAVTISAPPNAGTDGVLNICSTTVGATALFPLLGGGAQAGGTWTNPTGGSSNGNFNPANHVPGIYTYTILGTAPCPNDQATVLVTMNTPPNAGTDGAITFCSTDAPAGLFGSLGGGAQAGGTWAEPGGGSFSGTYDPAVNAPGVYTYTVTGTAPCPNDQAIVTVAETAPPNAGTDGAITFCSTGAAAGLFGSLGGGAQAGGNWTAPGGGAFNGTFIPGTNAPGVYTYTATGAAPCPNDQSTVTVTINTPPDPGTNGNITLCSSDAATSLFTELGGTPAAGGAWSGPSPVVGGMIDPATMTAGVYTYTVNGTAPCPNETATVTVTINTPPDPGTDGTVTLCSSGAAVPLIASLGGTPDPGGAWSGPSPVVGGMINPATMSAGVYTYTVNGTAPCPNATATVTVTINTPPDPGTDGTITLCSTSAAAPLIASLGGTPDAGSAWSGPSPVAGGMIDPATMAAGVYTYTVNGTAPCPNETATVTVTINTPPDPGTDGTVTLCSSGAAVPLIASLGGTPDAGGAWSGPSPVAGGMINPATMSAGVYTYTVNGTAPCSNETATVTVTINTPPDPGTNRNITLCSSDAATSLFAELGGTPDPGGAWSGPSPVAGGMIDPATMAAGVYTYTVNGTAPCPNETATVTVTINTPPDPGTDGTVTLCFSDAAVPLIASLGGTPDAGGAWSGPSPVAGGMIDPATMSAGAYTYMVTGTAPCPNETATVTVTINTPSDPGTDGTITLCSSSAAAPLIASLGGTPDGGGVWTGPSAVVGGMIDPATMAAGVYTYTVNGTAPCPNETATVTVTINTPPNPGTDGTVTLCFSDAAVPLIASLGGTPDAGGAWSGPSPVAGGMIDPATMSAGAYTYMVTGIAPCPNETATVTVTINTPSDPGTDGTITLCSSSAAAPLIASLGGTPDGGGAWTGPSAVVGGMIDPATMAAGVYTYTVNGTAPCPNETATVTVTINTPPDPGTDGTLTLCSSGAAVPLIASLGGTPDAGGAWSGPSPVAGGSFDPATMTAGVYTYTVAGTAPCPNETATVTVTFNIPPDPGTDGTITLCSSSAAAPLITSLGGTPDAAGAWSGPSPVVGGMIDPATMNAGVYTYTVNGTAPCPNETAMVTVTINTPPDPGTDGIVALCSSGAAAPLIASLGGTPDAGGAWSGPSPVVGGLINPATMAAGVYTYTVNGTAPCSNETAMVTVTINTPPDPGTNGNITLCSSDAATSLFAELGGTPDAGGAWSGPSSVVGGMIDPATMTAGVYTYTVNGTAPCPNETATVTVGISVQPNAGTDGAITLCISSPATNLFALLGGSPALGGSWSGPSAIVGGSFNPATMLPGDYVYTVNGAAPCLLATSTVVVSVVSIPDAGISGNATLCTTGAAIDLFTELGGTPDAGGTWTGPSAVVGGSFNPATMAAGIYTYTITVPPPCASVTSTVTIALSQPPDAGADATLTLCISSPSTSMIAALGGTPDAGGAWSGPSPVAGGQFNAANMSAGVYTYTVAGTAPCPAETTQLTIAVVAVPDAGTPGNATLCTTGVAIDLFAELGGTPDAGGTWAGPSAVVGGSFDPATMAAGVYTYTITVPPPCASVSSTVTIALVQPPDAGADATLTLCISSPATSMLATLGGSPDAGGAWSGPSPVAGGQFNAASMSAGVYTYTVAGIAPCPAETAQLTVAVVAVPDAGTPGNATLCTTGAAIDLFTELGGTPDAGGTWTGPSAVVGGSFDPATMTAGIYTYTITVPPPCASVSSTVTIALVQPPDAGADATLTLCISSPATSLLAALGGSPDAGGAWSGPSAVTGGQFNAASMSAGVYTYTVAGTAPCPAETAQLTVAVVAVPDAGTPGNATLCTTGAAIDLFTELGGTPDAGGTWTGPSAVVGGSFDPATMAAGIYTYTITVPPPCASVSSTVTIALSQPPDAGADATLTLCISSPATSMLAALGESPDAGGAWSGPSPVVGGQFNAASMNAGVYTYTVAGTVPCPAETAQLTVAVVAVPDAGTPGSATLCTTGAAIDLFAELSGTPDAGGTWIGPSAVVGGSFDPATMAAGIYTYTIAVPPPCSSVTSTVTVALVQPPNAGADGSVTLCVSSPAVDMLNSLGGSPDNGGSWSGPSAAPTGQFNAASMNAGVYMYTVPGAIPCPADASELTIAVVDEPDAGSPGSRTLCTSDAAIDLFAELNGTPDAGGAWSGPSAVVGGQFDPTSMAAGVYTYTITVPPPCASVSSTVTMTLAQPPDAGQDASLTLCISSPSTAMFPVLAGSPEVGGTWAGPSPVVGGQFNPANMSAGVYTYTVAGAVPCPATSATLTVDVVAAPDAGAPGLVTLCATDDVIDLFVELNGTPDAGGIWSGPSAVINGAFDPTNMTAGVYTYMIVVPPPCVNATSSVTVSIVQPPDAGDNGSLTLCVSSPSVALAASLGGSPDAGGTWTGPSLVTGGSFNPSNMVSGAYTYTVTGTVPCAADVAIVDVTVVASPDPGAPGLLTACASDAPTDLFTLIEGSPDAGGTWSAPNGTAVSGTFDPGADAPGVYTYTINVPPPCTSVSTTVTVDVIQPPTAGVDAALTLCISSPSTSLFPLLGPTAEPGGTWSGPVGAGSGEFDPATDQAGDYHYTVAGISPCPADIATVAVAVVSTPDPGTNGTITLCANDAPMDLFAILNGTPDVGGIWTAPNGATFSGPLDPSADAAGVYTYTIDAPPPCSSVSATVDVSIIQPPDAGSNGAIAVCATGAAVDLFNVLQGSPDAGGTWTNSASAPWSGTFDPVVDAAGTYNYRVDGITPCAAASASVTVSVTQEPNAGADAIVNLCIAGSPMDIFPSLGGASLGGTWSGPGGTSFNGTFTPGTSQSGDYVYTVAGTAPCPSASATVTVNQLSDPDAGGDGSLTLCSSHGPFDPYTALQGTPDAGGLWIAPNGIQVTDPLDAGTALSGTYTYVLSVPPPCVNDTALMVITIVPAVDAGSDGEITLCSNSDAVDLFDQLLGEPDTGGSWSGPSGAMAGIFTPGTSAPGNYTYSLQGTAPCPNVSAVVVVSVEALPDAGTDGSLTVCPEAPNVDLFSLLGGDPDTGGSWTAPDGTPCDASFDPGVDPVGNYTYTVFGITACPDANASSTVAIHVVPVPNAGPDQVVCSLSTTFNATGSWASGYWSGPSSVIIAEPTSATSPAKAEAGGVYTFVWNILTSNGCAAHDTVSVIFTDPVTPLSQVTDAICNSSCDGSASVTATGGNIGAAGYTYQWSNGLAGNVPYAAGICAGTYTVAVADTNGCSTPSPFTIGQPVALVIDAVTTTTETCPGSCDGTLTVSDAEGVSFSIGAEQQNSNVFTSLCGGSYSVTMVDAQGCTATSGGIVPSPATVIANFVFAPDTVFVDDPTVYFGNASTPNAFSFTWDFGGLGSSTESSPTFRFPDDEGSIYAVCLTAYDINGCSNEFCLPIPVFDLLTVSVPNAFTPNGDGINDEFLPIFNLPWVVDYKFMVFNRWGEQIFGTDQPGKPWKGDYSNIISKEEVYVWKLICRDQLSGDLIERIGHVTLLK